MRLEEQIALVNGAASGIGESAAKSLAREGCTVVLTDIQDEPLRKVTESLNCAGFKAVGYKMDVTKADEIDSVVSRVINQFGRIDILLQCSGIYTYSPFLEMSEEQFDDTIRVNLKGTFLCCQRVAREMVKKSYGRIICLASTAGQRGGTMGRSHYGASKGGVLAMCKSMANELGPSGITVNAIAPGLIYTNMSKERIAKSDKNNLLAPLAIKRIGGAEDVAGAVLFLASKEAAYITGATVDVNGGGLMR
jgi:NAD(P)-dependent dehydrogenase (short-subunit alcohol dehydrogenase family)